MDMFFEILMMPGQCFSSRVHGKLWMMSPQAQGANKFAVVRSHNNCFINFIQSTFLFIQWLKCT